LGFPNTAARVRAVSRHDLHHLVTGYDTDFLGEAEVAAWELASDCRDFRAAWVLNLLAMPIGMLRNPARVRRAFARGRSCQSLHGEPFTEQDRKSTRLNSSHVKISYAVFCLKKNKTTK